MQTSKTNCVKVIEKLDMTGVSNTMFNRMPTMTGNVDYKQLLKSSGALSDCTSVTNNDKFCLCKMNSIRSGLTAVSKGDKYVCDTLDMQ
jgi:hypothetical protein